jgi:Uma2 family endonuclease
VTPPPQTGSKPAPLENGDLLSAGEFLRRYEDMPQVKKAQLIEGIVNMPSPVRVVHSRPDGFIQTWLGAYAARTPGAESLPNVTVRLDADNVPQPDALLRLLPECGGRTRLDEKGYLCGPPELIVEVAASSSSIDARDKLRAYRRNGVKEYILWRTLDGSLDWWVLENDEYRPNPPDAQRLIHSQGFPGLVLAVDALLAFDGAKVLDALQAALQSSAHQAFCAKLQAAAEPKRS